MYPTVINGMSVSVILSTVIRYIYIIIHHILCLSISLCAFHLIAHTVFHCRLSSDFTWNKYFTILTITLPIPVPS